MLAVELDMAASPREGTVDVYSQAERITAQMVGAPVSVMGYGRGTLRYYGRHAYKPGYRCGVELESATGCNDGCTSDGWG